MSVKDNVADFVPEPLVGLNVTPTVVVLPGESVIGNGEAVNENSPEFVPDSPKFVMDRLAVPLFVMVTRSDDVVLTATSPKLRLFADTLKPGATPEPFKGTDCGLCGPLYVISSEATFLPRVAGANPTGNATLPCGATFSEPLGGVKVNSDAFAPFKATLEMVSVVLPVLVTTTEIDALVVFTSCDRKSIAGGEMLMPWSVPTPAIAT